MCSRITMVYDKDHKSEVLCSIIIGSFTKESKRVGIFGVYFI